MSITSSGPRSPYPYAHRTESPFDGSAIHPEDRIFSTETGTMYHYMALPAAAAAAIVPNFRPFAIKSALQTGVPIPRMTMIEAVKSGAKAAPTIGATVGAELIVDHGVKAMLPESVSEHAAKFMAAGVAGFLASPLYAAFTAQTRNLHPWAAMRATTKEQALATTIRETLFLASIGVAEPLARGMRAHIVDHEAMDYAAMFISGAAGSIIGHPADTYLTRITDGKVMNWSSRAMMRGSFAKAYGTGRFLLCYEMAKKAFTQVGEMQ